MNRKYKRNQLRQMNKARLETDNGCFGNSKQRRFVYAEIPRESKAIAERDRKQLKTFHLKVPKFISNKERCAERWAEKNK